jgi:hypothetical protein
MPQPKQATKRKRRKIALPVGAAGVSLALAGGASAIDKARAADTLSGDTASPREITFGEEEIADVSLATFYVFDKEAVLQDNVVLARACGGCRGCRGCAVARCAAARCAVARCAVVRRCGVGITGCGGCSCSCCLSWGACRVGC